MYFDPISTGILLFTTEATWPNQVNKSAVKLCTNTSSKA